MEQTYGLLVSAIVGAQIMISLAQAQTLTLPTYTAAQAELGGQIFIAQCSSCHGENLDNGDFGPPLAGPPFKAHWGGQSLDQPYSFMITQMPPDNPGGLDRATYSELMAFILSKNGVPPSSTELPTDPEKLKGMALPR